MWISRQDWQTSQAELKALRAEREPLRAAMLVQGHETVKNPDAHLYSL